MTDRGTTETLVCSGSRSVLLERAEEERMRPFREALRAERERIAERILAMMREHAHEASE